MREEFYVFDKHIGFCMRSSDYKKIKILARKQYEKYQANESNFIRCAILKLIREEEAKR
jgi:hypothetical protein